MACPYIVVCLLQVWTLPSVETLAKPEKHSIIASDVEKVAKSGEKWGKLWTTVDSGKAMN